MVLDAILIIIFILMLLYGYKKGFIAIVAKLVSVIVAFVLAYIFAQTVGNYILTTSFGDGLKNIIESKVVSGVFSEEMSGVLATIQNKLGFLDGKELSDKLVNYMVTGIGFIIVFLVARIVLWIAQKILESIFELPILKLFNKMGGVIASAILVIIEVSIILAVINSISTLNFMANIVNAINNSFITKVLYEHNIFTKLILNRIL